jgi:hypothetical protein
MEGRGERRCPRIGKRARSKYVCHRMVRPCTKSGRHGAARVHQNASGNGLVLIYRSQASVPRHSANARGESIGSGTMPLTRHGSENQIASLHLASGKLSTHSRLGCPFDSIF